MKIIVLAGGLSPERDVSLLSGAGICKTLREMGHQAFLLDVFFGLPCDSDKLEEVFDRPDGGLEISKGISTSVPDLDALRKSRPDQSPSEIGPNVIELCQMADITFMALHGSIGENIRQPGNQIYRTKLSWMYTVHEQTGYKTDLQDQWCSDSKRNFPDI